MGRRRPRARGRRRNNRRDGRADRAHEHRTGAAHLRRSAVDLTPSADERHEYCRQVESYLQKKNAGHLIRLQGLAFETVCSWVDKGVPLTAVFRGMDRYFERYYAKNIPRRRPVPVEFCEADVLDVFDEWRRAVGVPASGKSGQTGRSGGSEGLPAHLERVVARLTALRGGETRSLEPVIDDIVRELDAARAGAKGLRGEARAALLDRLRALDARLVQAARATCDAATIQALGAEADAELAPFRARMPPDTYDRSREACIDRLLRERAKLPVITFA